MRNLRHGLLGTAGRAGWSGLLATAIRQLPMQWEQSLGRLTERVLTRWFPPQPPPQVAGLSEFERGAWRVLGLQLEGRLLWSSNRSGNHELYVVEYFPRVAADGQWLVWGASAGGHEHDRADYEIFVWRIDDPWESAVRVTYSRANDQWPDLFVDGGSG